LRFDYDVGVGERAFQSDTSNQPEQRIGLPSSRHDGAFRPAATRATLAAGDTLMSRFSASRTP
jgi:hypothetical protein